MTWVYLPDLADWATGQLLDSAARGERMPGWAPEFGIVTAILGALVLLGLAVRAVFLGLRDRHQPEPPSLLERDSWLVEEGAEVPKRRYRGKRRAPRVPAHPVRPETSATQVIARVSDDPDSTAVLTLPRGRWGSR